MQRVPVPEEKKDNKYWERRRKNNEAAKKSRNLRRKKMDDELKIAKEAIQENQKLKQEIDVGSRWMSMSRKLYLRPAMHREVFSWFHFNTTTCH